MLPAEPLDVSIVICAYDEARWSSIVEAVDSVLAQEAPVREVVLVIDHNRVLLDRAVATWSDHAVINVVPSRGRKGLSGARNTGVTVACSEIVAFLDDDATAEPSWIARLIEPYADPRVVACGGSVVPALLGSRPQWWPLEFDWVVGCSYVGLPTVRADVRNVIGANMSARRDDVLAVGGFPEGIGRVGARPEGCEETDLYIRLARHRQGSCIRYEPSARVHHTVPAARLSWKYFRSRCFAEGLSKAKVAARVGQERALASERAYTLNVLPKGMGMGILGACRRERGAGLRALAIGAGLAITTSGYLGGRLATSVRPARPWQQG